MSRFWPVLISICKNSCSFTINSGEAIAKCCMWPPPFFFWLIFSSWVEACLLVTGTDLTSPRKIFTSNNFYGRHVLKRPLLRLKKAADLTTGETLRGRIGRRGSSPTHAGVLTSVRHASAFPPTDRESCPGRITNKLAAGKILKWHSFWWIFRPGLKIERRK